MADALFTKFFDKQGVDMNMGSSATQINIVYQQLVQDIPCLLGGLNFPVVSSNLIESQQIYILQEVTGPTSSFQLRKVPGSVTLTAGSTCVNGIYTDFTSLTSGVNIKIENNEYEVVSIIGPTSMLISQAPTNSTTTDNIYRYDYLSYYHPRSTPGVYKEFFNVYFENENQTSFFLYDIDYTENVPYITKKTSASYQLPDGSSDSIDYYSGRIQFDNESQVPFLREPLQLNIAICSTDEDNYQESLKIDVERQYTGSLVSAPVKTDNNITIIIDGTSQLLDIHTNSTFFLQGIGGTTYDVFYEKKLSPKSIGITGSNTYIVFESDTITDIPPSSLGSYRLLWKNIDNFSTISLYGEVEGEDERFKLVLENFGRKMDFDKEFIFRESDINEELPDYRLLNKKRKELLLEGDNIFPYMGSYKALINIINYFGYYDLDIKEYFLNVESTSPNYEKFMQVLLPRNEEQRKLTKAIWEIVPSKIWKKTSYFGLFYDLNKETGEYDEHGVPIVEDSFMFSPEEVLIKLFGLKELLKSQFLPLNARIIDITGEGIYFERIRLDTWSDNLSHLTVNIGDISEFTILPVVSYISDLRRIDQFYIDKFIEQGLSGFIGTTTSLPDISGSGSTASLMSLYETSLSTYNDFIDSPYDLNDELVAPIDNTWDYMPPSISNINFNNLVRRINPLPDAEGIPSGAPILLEALFDISWEEGSFSWSQLGILGATGQPKNINLWTWESIGRGQQIDCRWIVEKNGPLPFNYDSGRKPISDYSVITRGATVFSIPAKIDVTGMSGSSISSIQIVNPGYGYTSLPNISVIGTTGDSAIIDITLSENGYLIGGTVSFGGSGYTSSYMFGTTGSTVYPTVIVEPPVPQFETTSKILHAISLPYEGEYKIGLYLYDITNNFTVQFNSHKVESRKPEFVSVHRKETTERTWEDFSTPIDENNTDYLSFGEIPTSGARLVEWDEVAGPWYYPIHIFSSWEDAKISWESLNFSQLSEQTLFEETLDTSFVEINREEKYVILAGNQPLAEIGDSLFFTRNENSLIQNNIEIELDSIGNLMNFSISGNIGSTAVNTSSSPEVFVISNDVILIDNIWYNVVDVDSTTIYIDTPLISIPSGSCYQYTPSSLVPIRSIPLLKTCSRILITDNYDVELVNPSNDYYEYADLVVIGNDSYLKTDDIHAKDLILRTSSTGSAQTLYMSCGLFSGTYSIEITGKSLIGDNTRYRLNDVNKELYYLDGNFSISNADYDVDYAEYRIGKKSLAYEAADETTWEDAKHLSWFGLEFHGGSHCGFAIPFVSPGGSIRIDEFESFQFSGDNGLIMSGITGAKSSLTLASQELASSTNEGIRKFNYTTLPETELYMTNDSGDIITIVSNISNTIEINDHPSNLKIPATATAVLTPITLSIIGSAVDVGGYARFQFSGNLSELNGNTVSITDTDISSYNIVHQIQSIWSDGSYIYVLTGTLYSGVSVGGNAIIDSILITITNPGYGYILPPVVSLNGITFSCALTNKSVTSISVISGTIQDSLEIEIGNPDGYKYLDNGIWNGEQWIEVTFYDYSTKTITYSTTPTYNDLPTGSPLLMPYEYHKQLIGSTQLQQFYFFIHANAINPSSEMLCAVSMSDGVEGEWVGHPNRTYSYPLRNSLLFGNSDQEDYLYQKWNYEGSDYPPISISPDYSSNIQSLQSRIPYMQTLQSSYSFIDTVISNNQQTVPSFTPVFFNYDDCKIPGKTNPKWTIIHEETGLIQAISKTKNFMWNFTKDGNYSVVLEIEDANGNKNTLKKTSFIVIGKPKTEQSIIGRKNFKPIVNQQPATPGINILA